MKNDLRQIKASKPHCQFVSHESFVIIKLKGRMHISVKGLQLQIYRKGENLERHGTE